VILVGLTGGIGSGKSTVSQLLASRGAVIVDADAITRQLQAPGEPLLALIAERFGADVLDADGSLIRQKLADQVFGNPDALADLNKIVHPAVGREMARLIDEQRVTDNVVVLDIPLLAENPRSGLSGVIVVDIDPELAVSRLVEYRGMSQSDARARIERQVSREKRKEIADWVVDNSGDVAALEEQVSRMWSWMQGLEPAGPDAGNVIPKDSSK
jgi:dephospho-CoA kinase